MPSQTPGLNTTPSSAPARRSPNGLAQPDQPNERIKLVISGLTEGVEMQSARETSHRELDERMARGGNRLRRFVRGMIHGNVLREFHLLRNRQQAGLRIEDTGRLDDMTADQWRQVEAESIQRVIDDDGTNELVNQRDGERRDTLTPAQDGEIRSAMNSLLTDYVNGNIDRANLQEAARRRLMDLAAGSDNVAGLIGEGSVYMSNIVDIADAVRSQVTHERGIAEVLSQVDIVTARLNTGVNTEVRSGRVTRILDRIQDTHLGGLVNGTNVALGLAIAYGFGVGTAKGLMGKATRLGVFSAGAGVLAYGQERLRLRHERAQVGREAAMSENVNGTERRRRLAETLYDMRDASVLTEAMRSRRNNAGEYEITDQAGFDTLLMASLETTARMDLSAANRADYIRFSSREAIQRERREMMLERFRARAALRQYWDTHLVNDPRFAGATSFDDFFSNSVEAAQTAMVTDTENKDTAYNRLSRHYGLKRAGQALLFGAAYGLVFGEVAAHVGPHSADSQGSIDAIRDTDRSVANKTPLGSVIDWFRHRNDSAAGSAAHGFNTHNVGPNTVVNIDDRYTFTQIGNEATVQGPNGQVFANLELNPDGSLTDAAQAKLRGAGVLYSDHTEYLKGNGGAKTVDVPLKDYVAEHGTKVHRHWFDNDTKVFDKNELKLDLKTNANGDYVYDAARMVKGGSFHDGRQANMVFDNMKLLISPERGVQATPIVLDVDAHGQVIIPKNSPVAQFFEMRGGKPVFTGAYAEMAQVDGVAKDGSLNVTMLATDVGERRTFGTVRAEQVVDTPVAQRTVTIEQIDPLLFSEGGGATPNTNWSDVELGMFPMTGRGGLRRNGEAGGASQGSSPDQSRSTDQSPRQSFMERLRRRRTEWSERTRRRNQQARHDRAAADRDRQRQEAERRRAEEAARRRQQQAQQSQDDLEARRAQRERERQAQAERDRQRQEAADAARRQAEEAQRQRDEAAANARRQQRNSSGPTANQRSSERSTGSANQQNTQRGSEQHTPSSQERAQSHPDYVQAMINLQQRVDDKRRAQSVYDQNNSPENQRLLTEANEKVKLARKAATKLYRKLVEQYETETRAGSAPDGQVA